MSDPRADAWSDSWLTAEDRRALRAEETERATRTHPTIPNH